jgi:hypothetical protein
MVQVDDTKQSGQQQRPPLNWPTAALGLGVLLLLAFVAWLCSGVVVEWVRH